MKAICITLGVMLMAALLVIAALLFVIDRKEEDRRRAVREGYPWTWTKEDEKKAQAAMELICDKCHEPYRCSQQDELDEECAMCAVPDAVYRLAGREEARG